MAGRLPQVRVSSRAIIEDCLIGYAGTGWTGTVPEACHHRELVVPAGYGRWTGLAEPVRGPDAGGGHPRGPRPNSCRCCRRWWSGLVRSAGDWSAGFDTPEDVTGLPGGYRGAIWTNRADVVAPLIRAD